MKILFMSCLILIELFRCFVFVLNGTELKSCTLSSLSSF